MASEKTVVKVLPLPPGTPWRWYPDANVIAVSDQLDEAGVEAAICELQAKWRRTMVQVMPRRGCQSHPAPPYSFSLNEVGRTQPIGLDGS